MTSRHWLLLIVSCSRRKRSDPGLLAAIDRYDGGSFRVMRKAIREGYWPRNLDLLVLSAEHGLIDAHLPIRFYERRMTAGQTHRLNTQVLGKLRSMVEIRDYDEVYMDLGRGYVPAIGGSGEILSGSHVIYAEGRIGERLRGLKGWLRAKSEG